MVPFQYEHSRGGCISLRPYLYHLSSMMAAIVAIGAASYVTELGRGLRMALGSMVALLVFSVLLLPNSIYALPGSKAEAGEGEDVEGGETEGGSSDGDGAEEDRKGLLTGLMQPATEGERGKEEEGTSTPASNSTFVSFYGRHVPLSEVVKTWRAYCLMAVFCTVAGSGLLVINNIQAVAHAVGAEPSTFFVSLVSLANSLGRVGLGVLADALAGKVARLQLLALTCLSMACTLMVLSLGEPALLFLSLLLVGAAFGAAFGNVAAIAADLWGTQYIGSNYGFIDLSPIIGTYIFSTGLVAALYPQGHQGDEEDDDGCVGAVCFRAIFWVSAGCCLGAAVLCLLLHLRTPMRNC